MSQSRYLSGGARALTQAGYLTGALQRIVNGDEIAWDEQVFPGGQDRAVNIPFKVPAAWDQQDISFALRMRTQSNTGDSKWELHYVKVSTGADRSGLSMTQVGSTVTKAVPGTSYEEFEHTFTWSLTAQPSDLVILRLRRRGTLAGDDTGDISVTDFWIAYGDAGAGGGEANTADNVGAGAGVYQTKVGSELRFKSLVEGSNISIGVGADELTISATGADSDWTINGSDMYAGVSGNVGIGVDTPTFKLQVRSAAVPTFSERTTTALNAVQTTARHMATTSGDMTVGFGAGISFSIKDDINEETIAWIQAARGVVDNSGILGFGTYNAGSASVKMWLTQDGKLGLQTAAPGGALGIKAADTYIDRDGSNNLSFTDPVAGTKTLAQLAAMTSAFLALADTPGDYSGQGGKAVAVKGSVDGLEFIPFPAGITNFLGLTDTPSAYTGHGDKAVVVNPGATGLTFTAFPAGTFLGLSDTPGDYSGQAGKAAIVNPGADGLIFGTVSSSFLTLSDTPGSYVGQAGKVPVVNTGETALTYTTAPVEGAVRWSYLDTLLPTGITPSNLEALWQFDGSGDSLDDRTSNAHDLTLDVGGTRYGKYGDLVGLGFRGDAQYTAASPAGLRITGDVTIEILYATYGDTDSQSLVSCHGTLSSDDEAENVLYQVEHDSDGKCAYFCEESGGADVDWDSDSALPEDEMLLLQFVRNGTTVSVYQNGVLIDSATKTAPVGGGSAVCYIGGREDDTLRFRGHIFAVRITKEAFTAAQCLESFNNVFRRTELTELITVSGEFEHLDDVLPTGVADAALKAHFMFDETAEDLDDRSSTGSDLTLDAGTKRYIRVGDTPYLALDGQEHYKSTNYAALEITGALTVEIIAFLGKPNTDWGVLVAFEGSAANEAEQLLYLLGQHQDDARFVGSHQYSSHSQQFEGLLGLWPIGESAHIVMTRTSNGLTYKLYVNGIYAATVSASNPTVGGTASWLNVGASGSGTSKFIGGINSMRILDVEYTAAQALESYQRAARTPNTIQLVANVGEWSHLAMDNLPAGILQGDVAANYRFDRSGSDLTDRSTYSNDLTKQSGTKRYIQVGNTDLLGFDDQELYTAPHSSELEIVGALTIEAIAMLAAPNPGASWGAMIAFEGSAVDLSGNLLYMLAQYAGVPRFVASQQYGSGVQVDAYFGVWPVGEVLYICLTRNADKVTYKLYVNGVLIATEVAGHIPDGGTSSWLNIGSNEPNTAHFTGGINSVRILDVEYTADQVLEAYESVFTRANPVALTDLDDTPDSYVGQGGKVLAVNDTPDGIEFVEGLREYQATVDTTDLTLSATSQDVALADFPENARIHNAHIDLGTEFSGGSSALCTASVGDAGDPDELAAAVDVFTGAGTGKKAGQPTAFTGLGLHPAYSPVCRVTSDVNVNLLDAGSLTVTILYTLPR